MYIRLPELKDKEQIVLYIEEHYANNENNLSASNGLTSSKYEDWVEQIHSNTTIPNGDWGKSFTYLVFNNEDKLVGLLSIRHDMTKELIEKYGHIGYGVKPSERRKGYATEILKLALEKSKELGLDKVILGCNKLNIASAKTIIKNGGKLIKEVNNYSSINDFYKINLIAQYYEIEI